MGGHKTLNEPGKPKRLERWSPSQAARRGRLITLGPSRGPALLHHPVGHDQIAQAVAPGAHALVLVDQAGWHQSKKLVVPDNITLMPLPAKAPELNPVENIWQYMRENW